MSSNQNLIYINTSPKVNHKKDGSVFYTVLCGLSKKTLADKGIAEVDRLTMNIYENQLEKVTKAFAACKKAGLKLAIAAEDIVVTEPKANAYINRDGDHVVEMQASCWGEGETKLIVVRNNLSVSDELQALLDESDSDTDTL